MLVWRYHIRRVLIVSSALLILPLVQIVSSSDFVMRVSIPFILILATTFVSFTMKIRQNRWLYTVCVLYFLVASTTPLVQMVRTIKATCTDFTGPQYIDDLTEHANFSAPEYKESRYYKWLMKQ